MTSHVSSLSSDNDFSHEQDFLERELYEKRILAVEDEPQLQQLLSDILYREGYTSVRVVGSASQALALTRIWDPQVFLLDVMLPDSDGFDLLQEIRRNSQAPALFVSARDEDEARLKGLGLGADDYITKPFLPQELLLRLKAVLKRTYGLMGVKRSGVASSQSQQSQQSRADGSADNHDILQLGSTTINFSVGTVERHGESTSLTATEIAILNVLRDNRGIIVTTDALMESVWGSSFGYDNSLMVHMHRLRDKVEDDSRKPQWLLTVRGLGYRLANQ